MGNCLNSRSAVSWTDDDDEWHWTDAAAAAAEHRHRFDGSKKNKSGDMEEEEEEEERGLLTEKGRRAVIPSEGAEATEVKIKITKKQLEELLKQVDAQGLPLQQLLTQLMAAAAGGEDAFLDHGRHWRPVLQSIPEVSE